MENEGLVTKLCRKVKLADGTDVELLAAAAEWDYQRYVAADVFGRTLLAGLYLSLVGTIPFSLPSLFERGFRSFALTSGDGSVSALRRHVLLSAGRVDGSQKITIGSPFADPVATTDAELALSVVHAYLPHLDRTFGGVLTGIHDPNFPHGDKARALFAQWLVDSDRRDRSWAEGVRDTPDGPDDLPPR